MKFSFFIRNFVALSAFSFLIAFSKKCDKVIGGQKATLGQFPWQVIIGNNATRTLCGGSIVSERHVITAGHCVLNDGKKVDVKDLRVTAGLIDLLNPGPTSQQLGVKTITNHSKWVPENHINEFIILTLKDKFTFTEQVNKIRYANENDKTDLIGEKIIISGFGSTTTAGGPASTDLNWAQLIVKKCPDGFEQVFDDYFCARGAKNENSCSGDSGGPAVCKDSEGKDYLCGFASRSNCENDFSSYGRVKDYIDLIKKTVK